MTKHYEFRPLGQRHPDGLYDIDGCTLLLDAILNGQGNGRVTSFGILPGRRAWMRRNLPKTWLMLDGEEMFSRQGRTT